MKYKAILFDLDDTLLNSIKYWTKTTNLYCFKHFKCKPNKQFNTKIKELNNYEIAKLFVETNNLNINPSDAIDYWNFKMLTFYKTKIRKVSAVEKFLIYLKSKNYRLFVATATDKPLAEQALCSAKLNQFFEDVFCVKEIGYTKDNPEFFKTISQKINIATTNLLLFEDSKKSIQTAKNVNIDCIGICNRRNKENHKIMKNSCIFTIKNYKNKQIFKIL